MWVSAKAYAESVGFPVKAIQRFCRNGIIPCIKVGMVYQLKSEIADRVLEEMANEKTPSYTSFHEGVEALKRKWRRKDA